MGSNGGYCIYYLQTSLSKEKMTLLTNILEKKHSVIKKEDNENEIVYQINSGNGFTISLINPEARQDLYIEPLIFKGKRQALVWLFSDIYEISLQFYDNPTLNKVFSPIFCTIGRMLDAYLGIIASENNFSISSRELFEPSFKRIRLPIEGPLPNKLIKEFYNRGITLTRNAMIKQNPGNDELWDIIDGTRKYTLCKESWGYEVFVKEEQLPSKNLDYLEGMLKSRIWTNLYIDKALYESIGSKTISRWAKQTLRIGDDAFFIGSIANPSPFFHGTKDDNQYLIYKREILPRILDRIKAEYRSEIEIEHIKK